jgi:hypothetical protein
MDNLERQLHNVLPNSILEHYADQQKLTTIGVCGVFVLDNKEWAERLFNDNSLFSQNDIIHDFMGLMLKDDHFLPRI